MFGNDLDHAVLPGHFCIYSRIIIQDRHLSGTRYNRSHPKLDLYYSGWPGTSWISNHRCCGSCTVLGDFPITTLVAGGSSAGITRSSYYTEVFNGLSPMLPFTLTMLYPGEYGHPSGATPGTSNIWISWVEAAPVSTEITGPDSVEIDKNIQLDGTVANAWIYNWTTTGNCSLAGATDQATVTLKGVHGGSCTITRTACNGHNECVTDTHEVIVIGPSWMIPMYHLLLLQ